MVWVIVFIIVVGLIIEGGKPSSRERQPRRESPDRGAKDKELQEILNRARERKIREKARRQVAEKREAERVDRLFAELENLPQNQEQAKADLEWDSQVSLSAESAGSAATNIDGEAHVVSAAPSLLAKEFERWGINSLWHMTHIRNVPSIMRNGLLAHQSPKLQLMNLVDISDPDVQRWRTKVDPHFSRSLHEYVPLYINPRNPMLFRRREMQREICFTTMSRICAYSLGMCCNLVFGRISTMGKGRHALKCWCPIWLSLILFGRFIASLQQSPGFLPRRASGLSYLWINTSGDICQLL